ncbi:hypothetical protein OROGR_023763 [Orobanche gracilis]
MTCHSYTLDKFIVCVDKIVKSQLTAIRQSFGKSEISRYHKHNIPCFSLLRGVVSNEALDLMVKEIDRLNGFQLDSSTCGCQLYNSCGLPCACKLLDHIPNIFHRYIKSFNNVKGDGNCGFRAVVVGLGRDENICLLILQELLQELRYHEQDYTEIFTYVGFDYIWNTVNFSGTGIAPIDKWMSMPDTWLVIASFYRRPVAFISIVGSSTCFPLWSDPHESEPTSPIVVACVGGIHFINLSLREGCPIPSIHSQWRRYMIDRASTWEEIYSSRQM